MLPYPILPDVTPQAVEARLIAIQGVMEVTFGLMHRPSHRGQPCRQALLAMFEDLTVLMPHYPVICLGDDTGLRVSLGDSFVHPMPGNQRSHRGTRPPLRGPCGTGKESAVFHNSRFEPDVDLATATRGRLHFGQQGRMTDTIEALGDIHFQRLLWPKPNPQDDGFHRIPAGASWAKTVGMRCQLGFPCRFQGLAH